MSWPIVKVKEVCNQIRGVSYKKDQVSDEPKPHFDPLYRSNNISAEGYLNEDKLIYVDKSCFSEKQILKRFDILMTASTGSRSAIGKNAQFFEEKRVTFGAFCKVLRPKPEKIDPIYLGYFFKRQEFRNFISNVVEGANINNIKNEHIDELEIPLPPLDVQKQIAEVLEKADTLRNQCQQMEQELNALAQSVFLDMFGDPVTNPKGWDTVVLRDIVSVQSGATPSKTNDSYWQGEFPWVSPKDMKSTYISNSIDHISESVFEETNLKKILPETILIVVRGMILAHTVPIAFTKSELSINQDIKALKVRDEKVLPMYLLWCLKSQHTNILLKVSTAAHGTKRLDLSDLVGLDICIPPKELQEQFVEFMIAYDQQLSESREQKAQSNVFFESIMQRAFKGELKLEGMA